MTGLDVDLEIHAPGLDLHHERWNYHVLFMDEVHEAFDRIAAFAWQGYGEQGRGTVFVDRDAWMTVIRARWDQAEILFPCTYVTAVDGPPESRFSALRAGFRELIAEYDPSHQFVLTVEHHSADLLSTYLMRSQPGPEEAHQAIGDAG